MRTIFEKEALEGLSAQYLEDLEDLTKLDFVNFTGEPNDLYSYPLSGQLVALKRKIEDSGIFKELGKSVEVEVNVENFGINSLSIFLELKPSKTIFEFLENLEYKSPVWTMSDLKLKLIDIFYDVLKEAFENVGVRTAFGVKLDFVGKKEELENTLEEIRKNEQKPFRRLFRRLFRR